MATKKPTWKEMYHRSWEVLQMIREAIEEIGPVGAMKSSEHCRDVEEEGKAIVDGIIKLAEGKMTSSNIDRKITDKKVSKAEQVFRSYLAVKDQVDRIDGLCQKIAGAPGLEEKDKEPVVPALEELLDRLPENMYQLSKRLEDTRQMIEQKLF